MAELDCTNALQPCNCTANQICVQIGRSGTECARNTCVDRSNGSNAGSSGGGGKSIGALAGQAVGGVLGGLLIAVGVYWFWYRRRRRSATATSPRKSPNALKDFKIGGSSSNSHGNNKEKDNVTGPPGPGEEDAQPVKRQSLRFDKNNNPLQNRRSLSNAHNALPDNPFGDHHHYGSQRVSVTSDDALVSGQTAATAGHRGSQATMSEFSYRSSHSTNIIPIAYIPAHASQSSMADMEGPGRRPHSSITASNTDSILPPPRGNRASVPVSLRSSTNDSSSLFGGTPRLSGLTDQTKGGPTFSGLFDRRISTNGSLSSPNGLEIIATSPPAHSPPLLTPTLTKNGKPIRPPRAPGLDLKLPTPEPKSPSALLSPPISPGFPWASNASSAGQSPGLAPPNTTRTGVSPTGAAGGQRETLLSPNGMQRSSAYSTFSQTTTSTGSHMSYILDPPQVS